MTIEGSPTGTVPRRWCTAHLIIVGVEPCVSCVDREDCVRVSRRIFAMVLMANLLYAW